MMDNIIEVDNILNITKPILDTFLNGYLGYSLKLC